MFIGYYVTYSLTAPPEEMDGQSAAASTGNAEAETDSQISSRMIQKVSRLNFPARFKPMPICTRNILAGGCCGVTLIPILGRTMEGSQDEALMRLTVLKSIDALFGVSLCLQKYNGVRFG